MKQIKTDSDLVRVAKQIDAHLDAVRNLVEDLENCEHPNKDEFVYGLRDNLIPPLAWATHVVSHNLIHSERWETGDYGIRYKRERPE